ncbi:MAG TPA: hypothetical protein VHR43_13350 [Gemmatimonadales bacterium]|nr:hypothetical protein [Gemmatimonadales bacterium]
MGPLSGQACAVWVILEDDRPIGQVIAPVGVPVLGPGGDTVLLRRTPPQVRQEDDAPAAARDGQAASVPFRRRRSWWSVAPAGRRGHPAAA